MRCFIALDISEEVRHAIGGAVAEVKGLSKGVRWIAPGNIHLTLKFLGEVSDAMVLRIQERLAVLGKRHGRFALTVSGAGGFPNLRSPSVLWVGLHESEPLRLLNGDIDQSMAELGFEKEERRFSPHLTVGRVKERQSLGAVLREWATFNDRVFGTINVDEVLFMKSTLKPGGAEYSKIAEFKLSKEA